jgi:hypothetical protein
MVTNHQNNIIERTLPVYVYVKFAYQTANFTIKLLRKATLANLHEEIKYCILEKYNLEENHYELVEAGQRLPFGVPAEEAPAFVFEPSGLSIRQRFSEQNCLAFYIRLYDPSEYSQIIETMEQLMSPPGSPRTVSSSNSPIVDDNCCVICQETNPILATYFGCCHPVCNDCCNGCIRAEINHCAICRHYRIES